MNSDIGVSLMGKKTSEKQLEALQCHAILSLFDRADCLLTDLLTDKRSVGSSGFNNKNRSSSSGSSSGDRGGGESGRASSYDPTAQPTASLSGKNSLNRASAVSRQLGTSSVLALY